MRFVKKSGLAGVPGVVLTERDLRHLRSNLGLVTAPAGLGSAACENCDTSPGSLDRSLAAEVFKKLGSPELVAAASDPKPSPVVADAALLTDATMRVLRSGAAPSRKFTSEQVALLAGITSPTFAVLAGNTARNLRKMGPDAQYAAVLLLYINGAMDTAAGKNSPLARDYQKALRDLKTALQGADASQSVAQKLTLAGLGAIPSASERAAIFAQASGTLRTSSIPDYAIGLPGKTPSDPSRFYPPKRESIGSVERDPKDLGTIARAPAALDFVPFEAAIRLIYDATETAAKAQAFAKANATPTTPDPVMNAAQRAASWVIRTADPKVISAHIAKQNRFTGGIVGRISWLTLTRRYNARNEGREKEASDFEKHVATLLALAAKQCVSRTGQTGSYVGGEWRPDVKSTTEQVPQGPEAPKYVGLFTNIAVDPKIRPVAIFAAQMAYQKAYRKEPTLHALNWYGSFGYGLSATRDVFGVFIQQSSAQDAEFALRVGKTESLRVAGASPAPQDVKNQVNIFAQFFGALGPALSSTLDALNQSLKVATEVLCTIFKVLAGPDVGGVLCNIFTAVLKFLFGAVKAATAAVFSLLKAISGLIGKLSAGDFTGALYEFFAGVNTAVIFILGAPIAEWLGVPFLKSEERGDPASEAFMPSMERMGEDLTKRNPFFLIMLTVGVIAIITTPTVQNAGALMLTLTPVLALILVAPTAKGLRGTKDEWLKGYRTLVLADIQRALESILRLIAGVIVGVMSGGDAINVMGDRLAKWAEREGGAGPATAKTLQFLVVNLQGRFTSVTLTITRAFIKDSGFEMRELTDEIYGLLMEFLALIPAFATETGVFDKESMASANIVATVGATTVKDAKNAYDELVANLDARAKANLANEIATEYGGTIPDNVSPALQPYKAPGSQKFDAKKNLPLFAVVAAMGLTLGFMLRGLERK